MYRKFFKRFLDVMISSLVLLCLSPLLLLLTVWLHFANRGAGASGERREDIQGNQV